MEETPREKIHRLVKTASNHLKSASRIAEEAGDGEGARDLDRLSGEVGDHAEKFDSGM